jgi:hypothetical protein
MVITEPCPRLETVLVILQPDQTPLPPTSVINQLSIYIETEFSFEENDTKTPSPSPSPCYFDPTLEDCQPIDGKCPPGFGFNENDQCIPTGKCPDGYGRLDDDETGKCYKNSDIKICPDGYITHKNRECPKTVIPQPDPCECPSGEACPATACPEPVPCPLNAEGIEVCPPTDEPTPEPCPIDAAGNEVCPPTDEPTPMPKPPPPECPVAGPEVCGEEPPPEEGSLDDGTPPDDGDVGDDEDDDEGADTTDEGADTTDEGGG